MNKKIEENLDLPPLEEVLKEEEEENKNLPSNDTTEEQEQSDSSENQEEEKKNHKFEKQVERLSKKAKHSSEKDIVSKEDMEKHDKEMDEVSDEALDSYRQLKDLGFNVQAQHSGDIFKAAVDMLRISLDARNSKNEQKLKNERLKIEQKRLQRDIDRDNEKNPEDGGEAEDVEGNKVKMDRNTLVEKLRKKDE